MLAAVALGVGIGITLPPLTAHAMSGMSSDQLEDASALFSTFRQVGLALGVAVFGSLAATLVAHRIAAATLPPLSTLADLSVARLAQAGAGGPTPPAEAAAAIWRGLADTFRIGGAVALLATVPLLLTDPRWRIATRSNASSAGSGDPVTDA